MSRFTSLADLSEQRRRRQANKDKQERRIIVAAGTACLASGAGDVLRIFKRVLLERGLVEQIALRITGDHGFCQMAPYVVTQPKNAFYAKVTVDDVSDIVDAVLADDYVERLLYVDPATDERIFNRD
ncbi:MAG: (2Fe-2S) ferredoxin domain-containing protein, partial [Deltaproteobacteria bacterium]|nr:(2Fe-2S) ferredoxin domain-containing protein [Deltaproteobacteria bacterium]